MKKLFYGIVLTGVFYTCLLNNVLGQCVTPPLVAHWSFTNYDPGVGPIDDVGLFANTYVPNTTTWHNITGVPDENNNPNNAIHFNGQDSWVEIISQPLMNLTSWTILVEIKPLGFYNQVCGGNAIVWRGNQHGPTHYDMEYFDGSCGNANFPPGDEVFAGGAAGTAAFTAADWLGYPTAGANPIIVPGQWYCVAMSYNGVTGDMKLSVNGTDVVVENVPAANIWGNTFGTNGYVPNPNQYDPGYAFNVDNLFFGKSNNAQYPYWLNADVSDIKIFDGVFNCNSSELCSYNPCTLPTAIAHWGFNNASFTANMVDDINGFVAVPNGSISPASMTPGQYTGGLKFNGTSDYLQVPYNQASLGSNANSQLLDLSSWTITALIQPQGFYSGLCQGNAIVWRGNQHGPEHYNLEFFDNAYDQYIDNLNGGGDPCSTVSNNYNVFAMTAAGYPSYAATDFLGTTWDGNPLMGQNPFLPNPYANRWYCVTATYDAWSASARIWVDGVLVFSENGTYPNQYSYTTQNDLFIGSGNLLANYPYFFNGIMDDITIYSGATCQPLCSSGNQAWYKHATAVKQLATANDDVTISPNPATNIINIVTPGNMKNGTVTIVDALGRLVLNQSSINNSGTTSINIEKLNSGIYFVKINADNQQIVKKIVKD